MLPGVLAGSTIPGMNNHHATTTTKGTTMNRATFRTTTAADLQVGDVITNDHTATENLRLWEVRAIDTLDDRVTMTLGDIGYATTIEDTDTGRTLYAYGIAQPSPDYPVTTPADRIQHVFIPTAI